ncbi:MAG: UbiA family prenyltransferase [Candidatus Thermoplasmatota archaeon]
MNDVKLLSRFINFITNWRSLPLYELVSYIFMFASIPMIAYGIKPYNMDFLRLVLFTVITLYSGFFAALAWNDITDSDIDALVHPERPIPSGRISIKIFFLIVSFFSFLTFLFSYLISFVCFAVALIAALFVGFHNKFLKRKIKIPAYSEIFTPLQWTVVGLFGYMAVWTTISIESDIVFYIPFFNSISTSIHGIINLFLMVVFIYFTVGSHDLPEGIHDSEGDKKMGVMTYATSLGKKTAAKISFVLFIVSGLLGFLLFIRTTLSPFFLVAFFVVWSYTFYYFYNLIKIDNIEKMKKFSLTVGRKGYNYFLLCFDLLFLDVLIQLLINNF